MKEDPLPLPDILRLCILRGSAGPWQAMLDAVKDLVGSTYRADATRPVQLLDDFSSWLPGWLVQYQRLENALRWLDERIRARDCPTAEDQERALRNYLRETIRSGIGDFFRERVGRSSLARRQHSLAHDAAETVAARPQRISAEDRERLALLQKALTDLPPTLRVPFRLQHYMSCGPLNAEDFAWVMDQSGLAAEEVQQQIEEQLRAHQTGEFPLSAEFIGQLLNIPATADGRYTTVHQRVSRARQRLREKLAAEVKDR